MRVKRGMAAIALCALALSWVAKAQDLASFEKRTTVKVLPNGLTLIVCERPEAPVFSFYTLVDAGSADDPDGASGIAHMFEHMAFKGTTDRDWHDRTTQPRSSHSPKLKWPMQPTTPNSANAIGQDSGKAG